MTPEFIRTWHHTSNFFGSSNRLDQVQSNPLQTAAGASGSWIAIEFPQSENADKQAKVASAASKFVATFVEETKPVAIFLTDSRRLALVTPELIGKLLKGDLATAFKNAAVVPIQELTEVDAASASPGS